MLGTHRGMVDERRLPAQKPSRIHWIILRVQFFVNVVFVLIFGRRVGSRDIILTALLAFSRPPIRAPLHRPLRAASCPPRFGPFRLVVALIRLYWNDHKGGEFLLRSNGDRLRCSSSFSFLSAARSLAAPSVLSG